MTIDPTDKDFTLCIVGVAGFVGSHLLEKVIGEFAWKVIGIDMEPPHKIEQILAADKRASASRFDFHQVLLDCDTKLSSVD